MNYWKKKILLFSIILYCFIPTTWGQETIVQEYKVSHLISAEVIALFKNINEEVAAFNHISGNRIILKGEKEAVASALEELALLDQPKKLVTINLMLVEYLHSDEFDWGIDITQASSGNVGNGYYTPGALEGDITFGFNSLAKLAPNFEVNLRALVNTDKAKIVTNPHLTVEAGGKASIVLRDDRTIQLETATINGITTTLQDISAGIDLKIEPMPLSDSMINLKVKGIISEFLPFSATGEFTREHDEIETVVDVKHGESLIIGGMIKEEYNDLEGGFPVLKDIPLIGLLFKKKRRIKLWIERVLYITPHILSPNDPIPYEKLREATPLIQQNEKIVEEDPDLIQYKQTKKAFKKRKKREKKKKEKEGKL